MLLVLTVLLGVVYPLAITAVAQLPGLKTRADGSLLHSDGRTVGSSLIGQSFTDANGQPAAAATSSRRPSAGGVRPDRVRREQPRAGVDRRARQPAHQVCARSLAIGKTYGVDGIASVLHAPTASARCWRSSTPAPGTTAR